MSDKETKFDIWWSKPTTQRFIGATYSLGASVVIIGAMFKILHLPGASVMLGAGMMIEAVLFALGVFDKPHKSYEWEKVYDFEGTGIISGSSPATSSKVEKSVSLNYSESINDDDVKKLSQGIKNLSATAEQFGMLSSVVGPTNEFVNSINGASEASKKFSRDQEMLSSASNQLFNSYQGITENMNSVEKGTKTYANKIEDVNKNLSSINSVYEIQLQNIKSQSEGINQQTEKVRKVNDELTLFVNDVVKMKLDAMSAAQETEHLKTNTTKLAKQISDLNQVYGNMLNALS